MNNDIEKLLHNCIQNNISLQKQAINDNKNAAYYSNLIHRKYKQFLPLLDKLKLQLKLKQITKYTTARANNYKKICILIDNKHTTAEIAKKLSISKPTVLKIIRENNDKVIINKIKQINNYSRAKGLLKVTGHQKGKTYDQIYGIKKAKDMRKKRSEWLRRNNIRRFAKKISKPQALLYNIVKEHFQSAEIEYEIQINKNKSIWLDIAIPDKKICIEYDGIYWHDINKNTISLKDDQRDALLRNNGWQVYRIRSYKNLNEEELKSEFYKLQLV